MRYTVKEIYQNNAPSKWGVFKQVETRFEREYVAFGTLPTSVHDTELEAWDALHAGPEHTRRASGKQGG